MVATIGLSQPITKPEQTSTETEIVEISLLLPRWQIQLMENVAQQRGMNLAQMLRRMIGATFAPQTVSQS